MNTKIPEGYKSLLSIYDTQKAIGLLKRLFEDRLSALLNLYRVSAPLFVADNSGLNDNLNGYERRVEFTIKDMNERNVEVVQSLAKWKRQALGRYGIEPGYGLYTDMNAIRRDEELDNIHSIYVDQWDWEKVITADQRNDKFLEHTVRIIYRCLQDLAEYVNDHYPDLDIDMPERIKFIDSQELEDRYPDKTSKERERDSLLRNTVRFSSRESADALSPVSRTMAELRTMMTGNSTEISSCGTLCSMMRLRSVRWVSESMQKR